MTASRPPLRPRFIAVTWALMAAVLAVLMLGVISDPGPRDDPEPGRQRPGLLTDPEDAVVFRDLVLPGDQQGPRTVLLLFDRGGHPRQRVAAVLAALPENVALVAVVPSPGLGASSSLAGVDVVVDPGRRIADAVGLRAPGDGGFPTGYALIDQERRVRYATLDPGYVEHAFEIHILAEAVSSG